MDAPAVAQAVTHDEWEPHRQRLLQKFQCLSDRYSSDRYTCWCKYTSMINSAAPSLDDLDVLEDVAKDESEANLYRFHAYFGLAQISLAQIDYAEALANYRDALHLAETATDTERNKIIRISETNEELRIGDMLEPMGCHAKNMLMQLAAPSTSTAGEQAAIALGLTPDETKHLLSFGGEHCDCCHKSRKDAGVIHFDACDRCGKAFYCSEACQAKQWKAGHKKCCRKPGQVKAGDYMETQDIVSKPELNEQLVRVARPDPKNGDRWEVRILGHHSTVSLAANKLKPTRPLK